MSIKLTTPKEDVLHHVTKMWRRGTNHYSYVKWREECIKANSLYNGGEAHWHADDLRTLKEEGSVPITINVAGGFVDTMSGVEAQSHYRLTARIDEQGQQSRELGRALTQFLLIWQEQQNVLDHDSIKLKDALIGGLGWSQVYVENGVVRYARVEPLEMIFDADDVSPQLTNQDFIGRMHWMSPDEIRLKWKDKVSKLNLDDYEGDNNYVAGGLMGSALSNLSSSVAPDAGIRKAFGKRLVCELQYKVPTLAYQGLAKNGRHFTTFDIDVAEKVVGRKADIEEFPSKRILRTIFFQDTVLNHAFLMPSYPEQEDYAYIPFVWKRRNSDGVPEGIVEPVRGVQMAINAQFTSSVNSINANRVFISGNIAEFTQGYTKPEDLEQHILRKKSVTLLPEGVQTQFISGMNLGREQMEFVRESIELMKRIIGIYDDMRGGNSTHTSGVAEQIRVSNSLRTHAFMFDRFAAMKRRAAAQTLKLFQALCPENVRLRGVDKNFEPLYVNLLNEKLNGDVEMLNDINFLPFTLYLEEVPNFKSSLNQRKEELVSLLNNPHANILVMNPRFLDLFMDNSEEVAQGFMEAQKALAQIKVGADAQPQMPQVPAQTPSPQIPSPLQSIGV